MLISKVSVDAKCSKEQNDLGSKVCISHRAAGLYNERATTVLQNYVCSSRYVLE